MSNTENKTWFITGASKGLGLALTKYLLETGQQVVATSRNATSIIAECGNNENLLAVNMDITNETAIKNAVAKTIARFGSIDVIVNNAGYGLVGALEELTDAEIRSTMDVNLFGTINVIRVVMPHLRKQKIGYIINISSIAGYIGSSFSGSYDAAKFAVIGLTESLHNEVKDLGIKVTVVIPGLFRTNFMNNDSLQIASNLIGDYKSEEQMKMWQQYSGYQPGDPNKFAIALKNVTELENPPLHLLLGSDAYQMAMEKMKANIDEFQKWQSVSTSTDFAANA